MKILGKNDNIFMLDNEDIVNLICGSPATYETMAVCSGLYDYCDRTGNFSWHRSTLESRSKEEILALYARIKEANSKEEKPKTWAKAIVTDKAHEKRAFYICENCGTDEVSTGDKYCCMCGMKLKFEKYD